MAAVDDEKLLIPAEREVGLLDDLCDNHTRVFASRWVFRDENVEWLIVSVQDVVMSKKAVESIMT